MSKYKQIKQQSIKGFTFPGFLVRVFLYSSVLTTLLLPFQKFDPNCFLCIQNNSTDEDKQSEAKTKINSVNLAQQTYYARNNQFSIDLSGLALERYKDTVDYSYQIVTPMEPQELAPQYEFQQIVNIGQAKKANLSSYLGSVVAIPNASAETDKTIAVLCKIKPNQALPTIMPKIVEDKLVCPEGYETIK
ncbi:MAG: type IV pilin-like G/H family protein [Spirulinaceae cyanobacterium]